jgi:hypothetical protein
MVVNYRKCGYSTFQEAITILQGGIARLTILGDQRKH